MEQSKNKINFNIIKSPNNNEKLKYVQNDLFIMFDNKNILPSKLEWNKTLIFKKEGQNQ